MLNKKIKLIVYDFDGVMTNNKVYIDQNGNEMVAVNRADGLAIAEIKKIGIEQIIISTEKNKVVSVRARKLDIPCAQGIDNKKDYLIIILGLLACPTIFNLGKLLGKCLAQLF